MHTYACSFLSSVILKCDSLDLGSKRCFKLVENILVHALNFTFSTGNFLLIRSIPIINHCTFPPTVSQ